MLPIVAAAFLLTVAVARPLAQPLAFEVASVKLHSGGAPASLFDMRNGSFTATNVTLRILTGFAYTVPASRVVSGPSWVDSTSFDIAAKAPPGVADSLLPEMLRSLLAERFRLAARFEMRQAAAYVLSRTRQDRVGPQLVPSRLDCSNGGPPFVPLTPGQSWLDLPRRCTFSAFNDSRGTMLRGGAVTLADLARTLGQRLDAPVMDRTGIEGKFDMDLQFAPQTLSTTDTSDLPSIFTAVEQQLGLSLTAGRAPVEFVFIDHVERPTEN